MACPLCGRDRPVFGDYCQACGDYVAEALGIDGGFGPPVRWGTTRVSPIVRFLAPVCYLCGEAATEHADHVIPREVGGPDTWANIGGACKACNLKKGLQPLDPDAEIEARLANQQAAIRAALQAIADDPVPFWLFWLSESIEYAVETLIEDFADAPEAVDRAWVAEVMDDFSDTHPHIPAAAYEAAVDQILTRFRSLTR